MGQDIRHLVLPPPTANNPRTDTDPSRSTKEPLNPKSMAQTSTPNSSTWDTSSSRTATLCHANSSPATSSTTAVNYSSVLGRK